MILWCATNFTSTSGVTRWRFTEQGKHQFHEISFFVFCFVLFWYLAFDCQVVSHVDFWMETRCLSERFFHVKKKGKASVPALLSQWSLLCNQNDCEVVIHNQFVAVKFDKIFSMGLQSWYLSTIPVTGSGANCSKISSVVIRDELHFRHRSMPRRVRFEKIGIVMWEVLYLGTLKRWTSYPQTNLRGFVQRVGCTQNPFGGGWRDSNALRRLLLLDQVEFSFESSRRDRNAQNAPFDASLDSQEHMGNKILQKKNSNQTLQDSPCVKNRITHHQAVLPTSPERVQLASMHKYHKLTRIEIIPPDQDWIG